MHVIAGIVASTLNIEVYNNCIIAQKMHLYSALGHNLKIKTGYPPSDIEILVMPAFLAESINLTTAP